MPRDLPVGNGELMVAFDDRYQARDLFWPRVGMPNHAQGYPQRLGFWVDGQFAWVDDDEWQRDLRYKPETLATDCLLRHDGLGIAVRCSDVVDYHSPVWFRSFEVEDLTGRMRDARIFIHHDLSIDASPVGDTAYFDPELQGVVHYKDQRWFLVAGEDPLRYGVEHFTTGTKRIGDAEGTWRDAEDGHLSRNPIAQGSVDSTVGFHLHVPAGGVARATPPAGTCRWKPTVESTEPCAMGLRERCPSSASRHVPSASPIRLVPVVKCSTPYRNGSSPATKNHRWSL